VFFPVLNYSAFSLILKVDHYYTSSMRYHEYLPSFPLREYVECYWYHEFDSFVSEDQLPVQRCLPLGTAELIVQLTGRHCHILTDGVWQESSDIYFTGLFTDAAYWKASFNAPMFGIRLKPESFSALFNIPARELLNQVINAELILKDQASGMFEAMFGVTDICRLIRTVERFLLSYLHEQKEFGNYAREACRLIRNTHGALTVESLSERLFISKRQLQRSFKEQFGTSPKTYQRIIRFRNAYRYARTRSTTALSWSDVSYENGYADQAHFIRDFREFAGGLPSMLVNSDQSFFQTLEPLCENQETDNQSKQ
jgi:AraC-like DNA-binding protein